MHVGLCVLRLPPAQFWALTLPELNAMLGYYASETISAAPMPRTTLAQLLKRFPDKTNHPEKWEPVFG